MKFYKNESRNPQCQTLNSKSSSTSVCDPNPSPDHEQMGKGMTLNDEEIQELQQLISNIVS
jgi:hypothetical protein